MRSILALAVATAACVAEPESTTALTADLTAASWHDHATREHVAGDVYHYTFLVPVGTTPNAQLRIHRVVRERSPWVPRSTGPAVMLMHGDFASFETNFMPAGITGMATWLAEREVDVWGVDRRWTLAATDGDLSDFDAMSLDQELTDIGTALGFARGVRAITDGSGARLTLAGFSRGGELAYFYAAREATLPPWQRHVANLVPIDVYVSLAPADEDLRQFFCGNAQAEYDALAADFTDTPNDFQIDIGLGALNAPDDPSPIFPAYTNRGAMLLLVGQTYAFFPASPLYHLNAPVLDATGETAIGLRVSPEPVVDHWLAGAPPHQSMRESADTDAMTCGDAPLPLDLPISQIRVPLYLLGAAGGYGDHAIFSTTQVASTDVTTHVVRELPAAREAEDFGHADLLFAPEAPAVAWQPLLVWLRGH
jgi:hypothetical protein